MRLIQAILLSCNALILAGACGSNSGKHPADASPAPVPVSPPVVGPDPIVKSEPELKPEPQKPTEPAVLSIESFASSTQELKFISGETSGTVTISWSSNADSCTLTRANPMLVTNVAASGTSQDVTLSEDTDLTLACSNTVSSVSKKISFTIVRSNKSRQICNEVLVKPAQGTTANIYEFIGQNVIATVPNESILQRAGDPYKGFQDIRWKGSFARMATTDLLDTCDVTQTIQEGLLVLADTVFTDTYPQGAKSCPVTAGTILDYETYVNGRSDLFTEIGLKTALPACSFMHGYLPFIHNLKVYYYQGYPTTAKRLIQEIQQRPVLESFSVSKTNLTLVEGQSEAVTVSWESAQTDSCKLTRKSPLLPVELGAKGQTTVDIQESTDLDLVCVGPKGSVKGQTLRVNVTRPEPLISLFTASSNTFFYRGTPVVITFTWAVEFAEGCKIWTSSTSDGKAVDVKGSLDFSFTADDVVTLQCSRGTTISKPNSIAIKKLEFSEGNGAKDTSGELRCSPGSTFQPHNKNSNLPIGKPGYGFSELSACKEAIRASTNGVVCNWSGDTYQPYRISDGVGVGKVGYGFRTVKECNENVQASRFNVVCNWAGSAYSPYDISNNRTVGIEGHGFSTIAECQQSVTGIKGLVLCNWATNAYSPTYIPTAKSVGKPDYGFGDFAECQKTVTGSKDGYFCNYDGGGAYGIYQASTNTMFGSHRWNSLDACLSYVKEEI